jgi:formate dehydrogenase major subunit
VWTRQEPVFESPINLGAHCAKGASVREHGIIEHSHRLKTPMKLVNGKWQRISWDQALNEVGDKILAIKKESGPDAIYWVGSSKHNNEQAYLMRKFVFVLSAPTIATTRRGSAIRDGRRRSQHLGLRRDDHSYNDMQYTEMRNVHRQQRRRGESGVDAAHACTRRKPARR